MAALAHPRDREEPEEDEVHHRDQPLFEPGPGDLPREGAQQPRLRGVLVGDQPSHAVAPQADVGVDEDPSVISRRRGELVAGELFPVPSRGELFAVNESDPSICSA
jgi:hypothetical protein